MSGSHFRKNAIISYAVQIQIFEDPALQAYADAVGTKPNWWKRLEGDYRNLVSSISEHA